MKPGCECSAAQPGNSGKRRNSPRVAGRHLQEATRIGDWKFLKIAGQSFLFNLADDPMERANLKLLQPERFAALAERWQRWNGTMLPLNPASASFGWSGETSADRYGTGN